MAIFAHQIDANKNFYFAWNTFVEKLQIQHERHERHERHEQH